MIRALSAFAAGMLATVGLLLWGVRWLGERIP